MAFPDPFTAQEARALVRELGDLSHPVEFTYHFFERADLRDVEPRDVLRVMCTGELASGPSPNADRSSWLVTIEGVAAGTPIRVVGYIEEDKAFYKFVVKTVVVL